MSLNPGWLSPLEPAGPACSLKSIGATGITAGSEGAEITDVELVWGGGSVLRLQQSYLLCFHLILIEVELGTTLP